jgi:transposase-like protein
MSEKRRNFTTQFKLQTVLDGLRCEKTVVQICRERDISEALYCKGWDTLMERASDIFADQRRPLRDEQGERIAELE